MQSKECISYLMILCMNSRENKCYQQWKWHSVIKKKQEEQNGAMEISELSLTVSIIFCSTEATTINKKLEKKTGIFEI